MIAIIAAAAILCGVSIGLVIGVIVAWRLLTRPADDIDYSGGL